MIVMKVFGVQDVLDAFKDLPRAVRGRHMRIGLNAAAGVIRDMAVTFAPRQTGLLRKSLKVKVRVPETSYNAAHHSRPAYAVVGASRKVVALTQTSKAGLKLITLKKLSKKGFRGNLIQKRRPSRYSHLVERGTKGHRITAKNVGGLSSGDVFFGRSVRHPGTRGQHFLQRAVSFAGPVAQAKMIRKLKDGITQWAASRRVRSQVGRIGSVADFLNARAALGA